MSKTLFDKIWNQHVVKQLDDGSVVFFIDRHFVHEVTSPQAFSGLRERGIGVFRTNRTVATADHNVPTKDQHLPVAEPQSAAQLDMLRRNCAEFGVELFDLGHEYNGIVHVIGPELGLTQPGMTIVCGDSHTSTHGAFGTLAFGIGTSEVEMVLASQTLLQKKPKTMRIRVEGQLNQGVGAKDVALFLISRLGTDGATGHFVEYAGSAIRSLSMEGRMTLCNMSIEMGARGGHIQPDQTTFDYLRGRKYLPTGADFDQLVAKWALLKTDDDAVFDSEYVFQAEDIEPMITWGTNPGMAIPVSGDLPKVIREDGQITKEFQAARKYMGIETLENLLGMPVDYVFVGSCTNGRIEDLREFAAQVQGKKKAEHITAWIVPGSRQVMEQARKEGLEQVLNEAGFELREPGCSACLAMNEDKVPAGKYCVSTSNRNFEGRQGPGARTLLASPATAGRIAVAGKIV